MGQNHITVKPTYRPIKNDEMKTVATLYYNFVNDPAVLPLFTAKDPGIDGGWTSAFDGAIVTVGNIVPSKTIIKANKDFTINIKKESKKCVEYGKTLTYWLKKAFPDSPGIIEAFPILEANEKMRLGETEGLVENLDTITEMITQQNAQLSTTAWPPSNFTDFQTLRDTVFNLNVQQELAKKLIPDNTDNAVLTRNLCYTYIQTILTLKDMVYYSDLEKRHQWALATILNQIRGGGN